MIARRAHSRLGIVPYANERPDDDEQERLLAQHVEAATEAIERAKKSIDEIRRALSFPLAQSTRLGEDDEPR